MGREVYPILCNLWVVPWWGEVSGELQGQGGPIQLIQESRSLAVLTEGSTSGERREKEI